MSQIKKQPINLYNIRRKNSMQPIDWRYYTGFYPEKEVAATALHMDTDLSMEEAREVIDEIYNRVERGEVEIQERSTRYFGDCNSDVEFKEDMKNVGKGVGCGGLVVIYIFLSAIFSLAGVTSGRKRRRRRW